MPISPPDVPLELTEKMLASRERLRRERPRVHQKLMRYLEAEKQPGQRQLSLIDFAYGFECNFTCTHCCADIFQKRYHNQRMPWEQVKHLVEQADELGVFVFSLIGGEPLVWPELDDLIALIDPARFLITLTTNGWLLSAERAAHLARLGVSKINVSLDSGFPEEHDAFRMKPGSYARALAAIENGLAAGLNVQISTVVTHQNLHGEGFQRLLDLAQRLGVSLDLQVATPVGKWLGNQTALIDAHDAEYMRQLRTRYPLLRRDLFSTPGALGGCPAVTGSLYIIATGEVLPCLFIHLSLGNVLNEPLAAIRQRGLGVDELREFSSVCLAGEKCAFFDTYMVPTFKASTFPLSFEDGIQNVRCPAALPAPLGGQSHEHPHQ